MTAAELRALVAEVLDTHHELAVFTTPYCSWCRMVWPCHAVQLARAVERLLAVAAAAKRTQAWLLANSPWPTREGRLAEVPLADLNAALAALERSGRSTSPMASHDERAKLGCSETYDTENDVYYVTFNTGEPSYCVELDDAVLIEVGLFSGLPTGFRLLNYTKPFLIDLKALLATAATLRQERDNLDRDYREHMETLRQRVERVEQAAAILRRLAYLRHADTWISPEEQRRISTDGP